MNHQEGYFKNKEGQSIFHQQWLPTNKPKAVFLVCHGLNEHSGRYQHLAKFFTEKGYGVYGFDHIGHGKSDGTRSFVKDFPTFTDPIHILLNRIKETNPDVPVILLGHSLGGLIGIKFLIDNQEKLEGAVISGALVMVPEFVSEFTVKIGTVLSKILPKVRLEGIEKSALSRDPEVVDKYINDPLVYNGKATARISSVILEGITYVAEKGSTVTTPVLLLHGGQDRICSPSWSTYLHNLVSSQQNQLIIYDELFHEIYNEPEQDSVFADVLNWQESLLN